MESFSFFIHKPKSVCLKADLMLDSDTLDVSYYIIDCLTYKKHMKDFVTSIDKIKSCKKRIKIFLNIADIIFYIVIAFLFVLGVLWQNNTGLHIITPMFCIGYSIIILIFSFLHLTPILEICLVDGNVYYIPTSSFIISTSKQKRQLDTLYQLLNRTNRIK